MWRTAHREHGASPQRRMRLTPYYQDACCTLYSGDCQQVMPELEANSFDACITDPPYGLKFMGKSWDHGVPGVDVWREVYRVLKPGAFLLGFGGTRTHHRLMCAIEDAGFEIRDCLMWLYGSGFPKSLDISKAIDKVAGAERAVVETRTNGSGPHRIKLDNHGAGDTGIGYMDGSGKVFDVTAPATDAARTWNGYGTALKPAWEPIIVAMKPTDGTFAENALKWGVAGLAIDAGRIACEAGSNLNGGFRFSRAEGWDRPWKHDPEKWKAAKERGEQNAARAESLGRWPANLILDEEAARMLDEQSGETCERPRVLHHKSAAGFVDTGNGFETRTHGDSGGASRFFYTAKADSSERGTGNNHPTVKPVDLMRYLCKLVCPPTGGALLDPFAGSGSTILAARGFFQRIVAVEIEERYCQIQVNRLAQEVLDLEIPSADAEAGNPGPEQEPLFNVRDFCGGEAPDSRVAERHRL